MGAPGVYFENEDAAQELLSTDEAFEYVQTVTDAALAAARQAQVDATGAHDAALYAEVFINEDGIAEGVIGSTSSTWHLMEFGSRNNRPFRPLTIGVESVVEVVPS